MARSGFALLIVLAVLATAAAVVAGMLAVAHDTARTAIVADQQIAADDLLSDSEAMACAWLDQHANAVSLPPSGGGLVLAQIDDQDGRGRPVHLTLVLLDAAAGLPRQGFLAGYPLRTAVPTLVGAPTLTPDALAGSPQDLIDRIPLSPGWARFPTLPYGGWTVGQCIPPDQLGDTPTLGFWFCPDNDGNLNVNTMPEPLLRQACRLAEQGDADAILAARRAGRPWQGNPPVLRGNIARLTTGSATWHLLAIATIGGERRCRWACADGAGGHFHIIARHDAADAPSPAPAP